MAAAPPARPARARGRQGGDGAAAAHARRRDRRLALRAAARLGHGGRGSVCDLGLRPRGHAGQARGVGRRRRGRKCEGRGGGTGVIRTMGTTLAALALALATALAAQEFHPPPVRRGGDRGTRLGLFGFGVRGGLDLGSSQLVLGTTLDAGNLFDPLLRLRTAVVLGICQGATTYAGIRELAY